MTCCATPITARSSRSTITWTTCRSLPANRRRFCRASTSSAPSAICRASISAAAVPTSARSAPSSTCRGARAASARPTIWKRSCARITRKASSASSSPTTISPATTIGKALFDRMIQMREGEGMNIGFTIQVDTLCHKIPGFIEKATKAGVRRAFIGLENINPDNLIAAKKRQNKITEYREMLQMWRNDGAITYAGYILGFPGRHQGIDPARRRDHQARIADRYPGVLLPDAAARLGGPQGSLQQRHLDGPGHEQIRPQPPGLAPRHDVGRGLGGGLSRGLGGLLHAGAHQHDPAPHLRLPDRPAGHHAVDHPVVLSDDPVSRACIRSKAARSVSNSGATGAHACRAKTRSCSMRATGAASR